MVVVVVLVVIIGATVVLEVAADPTRSHFNERPTGVQR